MALVLLRQIPDHLLAEAIAVKPGEVGPSTFKALDELCFADPILLPLLVGVPEASLAAAEIGRVNADEPGENPRAQKTQTIAALIEESRCGLELEVQFSSEIILNGLALRLEGFSVRGKEDKVIHVSEVSFDLELLLDEMIERIEVTLAKNCEVRLPIGRPLPCSPPLRMIFAARLITCGSLILRAINPSSVS